MKSIAQYIYLSEKKSTFDASKRPPDVLTYIMDLKC